ncbi:hypothetical protein TNCV_2712311 [Trichonephila clavipes]|nr:hypothetical protein TNCV_2712311 [Trichonephila clavipes]
MLQIKSAVYLTHVLYLQLFKLLQVPCKSERLHHGTLVRFVELVGVVMEGIRQAEWVKIIEMGQRFQIYRRDPQIRKYFFLVASLYHDEASFTLGQVAKLAPETESQVFQGHGSGKRGLQMYNFVYVPAGPVVFRGGQEARMIDRDA